MVCIKFKLQYRWQFCKLRQAYFSHARGLYNLSIGRRGGSDVFAHTYNTHIVSCGLDCSSTYYYILLQLYSLYGGRHGREIVTAFCAVGCRLDDTMRERAGARALPPAEISRFARAIFSRSKHFPARGSCARHTIFEEMVNLLLDFRCCVYRRR